MFEFQFIISKVLRHMSTIEQVLEQQRSKTSFDVQKMSEFLFEPHELALSRQVLGKCPPPSHDFNLFNKGRLGVIIESLRKLPGIYNTMDFKDKYQIIYSYLGSIYQMPGGVHVAMFTFYVDMMGTDRQREEYLKKCVNWDIIGCYAQTELGHGSDVQNLETTAVFNEKTKTFTLNTPTVSAAKYWPGQLGLMSNWALVFAQLIVKGVKHGVHGFLVPIRDQNHNLLPGIQAGDIGPKIGFQSKDNGFLILHNVQIPKRNMLRRYVSVSNTGQIKKKGDPKVSYATMMSIRQHISCASPKAYSLAIITAVRYSCWRKQFQNSSGIQQPVIQYQTQLNKIIPRVAEYFAMMIGGNNIRKITDQNFKNVKEHQNFSLMNETHACLCLGKAFYTETTFNGMEICRKACGGHGFSHYSGMPSIIFEYSSNLTMEGENSIMYLQVARYVMKCYKYFITGKKQIGQSAAYINSYDYLTQLRVQQRQKPVRWTMQHIRLLLAQAVCNMITKITGKIMSKPQDMPDSDVTSYVAGSNLHELGIMHAAYYTYNCFKQAVEKEKNEKCKVAATQVCMVYGIEQVMRFAHSLIEGEFVTPQGIEELKEVKEQLLKVLRPNLIGLVDAFDISERLLTNGLASGNPYENYLKMARECDINTPKGNESGLLISKGMKKVLADKPMPKL